MRKFIASIVMLAAVLSAGAQALPSRFAVKIKSKDHVQGWRKWIPSTAIWAR